MTEQTSKSPPNDIYVSPRPKKSKKVLYEVIFLLILLVGFVGYCIFRLPLFKDFIRDGGKTPQTSSATQTKSAISTSIPDPTANWNTYTDSNLNYSFQYPPTSCELQRLVGDTTFAICYLPKGSDGGSKHNNGYVISLGFISKSQINLIGVTYCGAYPNDSSRCELFRTDKVAVSIDWGTDADGNARAWISHPNGGIVTFDLQSVTAESKEILNQILSTFKFTN